VTWLVLSLLKSDCIGKKEKQFGFNTKNTKLATLDLELSNIVKDLLYSYHFTDNVISSDSDFDYKLLI